MTNGIIDIDHVMCQVADTEQAKETFERLGFSTTPRSSIASGGVANRLVILTPKGEAVANFVELMAIEDTDRLEPSMASVLAGRPGIKSLVNALGSAESTRDALSEVGFSMLEVWPKERTWRLPSGEELLFSFRVLLPEPGQVPLMFNGVEYLTLEHYLRPEFQSHPNGALRWTRISAVIAADDFDDTVAIYERLFGSTAERRDGQATVTVRDTSLRLLTPDLMDGVFGGVELAAFAPPCYVAITIEVSDLTAAGSILAANGVRHIVQPGSLVIDPGEAGGMVLELIEDHDSRVSP